MVTIYQIQQTSNNYCHDNAVVIFFLFILIFKKLFVLFYLSRIAESFLHRHKYFIQH